MNYKTRLDEDDGVGQIIPWCREYTLSRVNPQSRVFAAVPVAILAQEQRCRTTRSNGGREVSCSVCHCCIPGQPRVHASHGMAHHRSARWMVAGVAWTEATGGTVADGAGWRWAPEGTSTSSPTERPAKAGSGKSFPQSRRGDFGGERTRWEVGGCDQCVGRSRPSSARVEGGSSPGTITGAGATCGRSHQGHEDVHREVEETSGSVREDITKAQAAVLEAQAKLTKEEEALEDCFETSEILCSWRRMVSQSSSHHQQLLQIS